MAATFHTIQIDIPDIDYMPLTIDGGPMIKAENGLSVKVDGHDVFVWLAPKEGESPRWIRTSDHPQFVMPHLVDGVDPERVED